ncbi:periplasmic protease [Cryptosporangium arvum DSM 44712]|uniref:Periplasmic protease n=1 Tax=Cryptosporangium arvum DSM 44712 TaxID=927661 RepID=A0A010YN21_9ACTN|nr:periplasmic protease [Cryptosporangium arvum DSM 44712]
MTIVEQVAALVDEHYVFPAVGPRISAVLRRRLDEGAYAGLEPEALATRVTTDLQSVNGDRHTRLVFHADELPADHGDDAADAVRRGALAARWAGGVTRAELLEGNVAVVALAPILFPPAAAGESVGAAMTWARRSSALILDLRRCLGGDPRTVTLVCGYLVGDERVHVNSLRDRHGDLTQFWTSPALPGRRFGPERPVAVLTGADTFSSAEELAYDLQQLGRAEVIGERTPGGAHNRRAFRVHPHLEATISVSAAVNPVTGTNWEGVGVVPDVEVPAADALDVAHRRLRVAP